MESLLLLFGRVAGAAGVLTVLGAVAVRATGRYSFAGFDVGTVLSSGMAAMMMGCLCLLLVLTNRAE